MPEEIIKSHNSPSTLHNNRIHMRMHKGMHGLQESGALSNEQLRQHLATYSWKPIQLTLGLWKHDSNKLIFFLVLDNFGVKHLTKVSVEHPINALKDKYEDLEVNWKGEKLCDTHVN